LDCNRPIMPSTSSVRSASAERQPLLRAASGLARVADDDAADSGHGHPSNQPTPLPKLQIALLAYTRVCEPLAFAILFPFVNSMVLNSGEVTPAQVGYYVGLIESCFSLTQMVLCV
jgi:hypothetical protein